MTQNGRRRGLGIDHTVEHDPVGLSDPAHLLVKGQRGIGADVEAVPRKQSPRIGLLDRDIVLAAAFGLRRQQRALPCGKAGRIIDRRAQLADGRIEALGGKSVGRDRARRCNRGAAGLRDQRPQRLDRRAVGLLGRQRVPHALAANRGGDRRPIGAGGHGSAAEHRTQPRDLRVCGRSRDHEAQNQRACTAEQLATTACIERGPRGHGTAHPSGFHGDTPQADFN